MPLNIVPEATVDGIVYGSSVPLTPSEATLSDGDTPDPIPIAFGQEIVAVVRLVPNGQIVGNNTYVVMQTDLNGDGIWIDVAWLVWTGGQGGAAATFVLCGGGRGAMNNAFQQSRQSNSAPTPQANGSNAVPLGGRVRFVGKNLFTGGSSSVSGTSTAVLATITYKLSTPR